MNTTDTGGLFGGHSLGGLGYGIGVSVGVLLLITTITVASYFCARNLQPTASIVNRRNNNSTGQASGQPDNVAIDIGLDEATIASYPKVLYSEAKLQKKGKDDSTSSCCSVCLADYKSSDDLRLLPECGHMFHVKCVDPWLRSHPTCPVCRSSPMPTPLSTPLAEVVPLASRRD